MKKYILVLMAIFWINHANSQVLISLLFGDKLNSPHLEFGLEGGVNFATISNLQTSGSNIGFNLGFYFDIKSKKNPAWMLNTGVIVKSPMGAKGLPVYELANEDLNKTFAGGTVEREIRYFNVPILVKYQFHNNIYVKAGPMLGLLSKAFDEFSKEIDNEDVIYKNNIRDRIHVIDAGLAVGLGYHLKTGNGMNIGIQYYHGLVPVMKGDQNPDEFNRSFYIVAAIPIGKGKAAKEAQKKKAQQEVLIPPQSNSM